MDLPSEDSELEDLDDGSDDNMDDYYDELGIRGEKDFTGTEELYKKSKKKGEKEAKKVREPTAKAKMIDTLIANTKSDPNYKNIVKVIKIVKTLFNKDQETEDKKV